MASEPQIETGFKLGAKVRIKNYQGPAGKIVELRGPLGPNGIDIYRVAIPMKPGISLIEVRENQLELVATKRRSIRIKPRKPKLSKKPARRGHEHLD